MKASKKIALLEQALDYVLHCTMLVSKHDEEIARAFDMCGVPAPSTEVQNEVMLSGYRIEEKLK